MPAMRTIIARFGSRPRRILFALIGWIAVLTFGAGKAPESDNWLGLPDLGGLLVLVAVIAAVIGALIITFRGPQASVQRGPPRRVPAWAGLLGVLLVVFILLMLSPRDPFPEDSPPEVEPSLQAQLEDPAADEQPGGVNAGDIAVLLAIAVATLLVLRRTGFTTTAGEPPSPAALAPKLDAALDNASERLSLSDDPRDGVMAAYAALEGALAEQRRDRRPTETPSEHMTRALAAFPVIKRPAVLLAHLYELARFSDYPITAADRDRAAAALNEARGSLTAAGDDPP